ncbi:MAG: hypothetical protein HZA04_07510 [Nitrospinae bacterium]|nr:hypothetical protein [Nitrospinota bacterium]
MGVSRAVRSLVLALCLFACEGPQYVDLPSSSGGVSLTGKQLTLTATPAALTMGGTASIAATLKNSGGSNVANGTQISFSSSDTNIGTITASATTSNGVATALFDTNLGTKAGTVSITATSGGDSAKLDILVSAPATGSIEFSSATPSIIGIKGSGSAETSLVSFLVKDTNGSAVVDGAAVDICLKGPSGGRLAASGGEYVGDIVTVMETFTDSNSNGCYDAGEIYTDSNANGKYDSPLYTSVSTSGGTASVVLHTGAVSGNVTLLATVVGKSLSTASSTISIGGGVLSDPHFTVGSSKLVLFDPSVGGITTATLSVYLADRFGNGNVLKGTTVSFYAEAGATEQSSVAVDDKGAGSVVFRTQNPLPQTVDKSADETALLQRVLTEYGITPTGHPSLGWVSILVMAKGEENFTDTNANGVYDTGDTFSASASGDDTPPEPYLDVNDSGARDSANPFEMFVDVNNSGAFDGTANGKWDSTKTLFKRDCNANCVSSHFYGNRPSNSIVSWL